MEKAVKLKEVKKDFLGRVYVVERCKVPWKERRIYLEKSVELFVGRILKKGEKR